MKILSYSDYCEQNNIAVLEVPAKAKSTRWAEVRPLKQSEGLAIYGTLVFIGVLSTVAVAGYIIMGSVMLTGLVAVIETNKYVKTFAMKSNYAIDTTILVATIWATASLGITMTASLAVMGLGYTLIYSPYLRRLNKELKSKES